MPEANRVEVFKPAACELPENNGFRIGLLVAIVLLAGFGLLAFSALPPRLVNRSPLPVWAFMSSRGYIAVMGVTLFACAALAYALGALRP